MTKAGAILYESCTVRECEATHDCTVCGRRKKPYGRDSMDNGLCDRDCKGYAKAPNPGHLWPGELARIRAEEKGE